MEEQLRVTYCMSSYELPLFRAFGFFCRKAWFPFRRLLRAIKRVFFSLIGWISTLVVFIPLCVAVFAFLIRCNFLVLNEAVIEFVSIILGSFVLLAIKELRDSEAKRREALRKQWDHYCRWRFDLTYALGNFFSHIGVRIEGYSFLDSMESWENACNSASACAPCPDECFGDLEQVMTVVYAIIDTAREVGFIDWNAEAASNYAQNISNIMTDFVQGNQTDHAQFHIDALGSYAVALLAQVRRPWRYRNDMAHKALIEKYLDQHGILIKM